MANGLFHRAIMESGVADIPYLKAPEDERNEDVRALLTALQLPPLGQERMGSGSKDHGHGCPYHQWPKNWCSPMVSL